MSDEEAVAMAIEDPIFFGHIVDRYQDKLNRYIARIGIRNAEDREDVLQDIFVKVYRNLYGFDTSLAFSSWIYRIAHNEAISWHRKLKIRPEGNLVGDGEVFLNNLNTPEEGHEVLFDKKVNADEIQQALDNLPEKYKSVLILRYFEHMEYDQISDVLKIPVGSVGTLIYRGKQKLKNALDQNKLRL